MCNLIIISRVHNYIVYYLRQKFYNLNCILMMTCIFVYNELSINHN